MAHKDETMPAGEYELLADYMPVYEIEKETVPGPDGKPVRQEKPFGRVIRTTDYRKGDIVPLTDEVRIKQLYDLGVIAKPGELQRRAVEQKKAEAAVLVQQAKEAEAKVKATEKAEPADVAKAEAGK